MYRKVLFYRRLPAIEKEIRTEKGDEPDRESPRYCQRRTAHMTEKRIKTAMAEQKNQRKTMK